MDNDIQLLIELRNALTEITDAFDDIAPEQAGVQDLIIGDARATVAKANDRIAYLRSRWKAENEGENLYTKPMQTDANN